MVVCKGAWFSGSGGEGRKVKGGRAGGSFSDPAPREGERDHFCHDTRKGKGTVFATSVRLWPLSARKERAEGVGEPFCPQ